MAIYSYQLSRGQTRWQFIIDLPSAADGKRRQLNRKGFLRQEDVLAAETTARQSYGLVDADAVTVRIDKTFALADAAEAHRSGEKGHTHGKLVLRVAG